MKKNNSTETLSTRGCFIDEMNNINALTYMLDDQWTIFSVISEILPDIDKIVDLMYQHIKIKPNANLIYSGAGTSGRIGVQDGTEIYPTFGWPKERVKFIIAGGPKAVFEAVENAEDDTKLALEAFNNCNISSNDIVIGLSASGNTLFTSEIIRLSSQKKALTVGISNNLDTLLHKYSKHIITINTGSEAIAGSTRLKAGTSQKIILNLISTLLFTRLGFVKKGMMTNMIPTNKKLRKRKKLIDSIISEL